MICRSNDDRSGTSLRHGAYEPKYFVVIILLLGDTVFISFTQRSRR